MPLVALRQTGMRIADLPCSRRFREPPRPGGSSLGYLMALGHGLAVILGLVRYCVVCDVFSAIPNSGWLSLLGRRACPDFFGVFLRRVGPSPLVLAMDALGGRVPGARLPCHCFEVQPFVTGRLSATVAG